ncbi:carbohydrate ABC transporter permease [Paenibacillus mucilaginosus]|uniref:Binding-protein-dependent transport systems inner membrane component n=3 Tax=Paenibacillus mucilaginosus TaxID=61624 RepID=H6NP45_9BACL|nr:carbohydrate ABC transporter permease [Paenibacillus mucilaginosus]AEI43473.1 binding-protein-dependent transport systems inner membrane component [Paenibacillus mucilaginosus KNP414]AFC31119.1 binding-protein-dependent transport systems inner membrane component [Paenibacillus mucilaginosus 3016]AFH63439.1 sugar ABC transporter permease [Paenibacillus mucilaginosus K02]MCG7211980.1 carbohydrate ABC transporter permease [Paenibacillus mucilaginosus]WDM25030.1 carbohydrate ABC transporter per
MRRLTALSAAAAPRRAAASRSLTGAASYVLLTAGVLAMVFPFLWMVATSLKPPGEVFSLSLIPQQATLANYAELFRDSSFPKWISNSFIVALVTTASVIFFDTITGYVLAKFSFYGKQVIFVAILSTLMVPTEMLIIPWYLLSVKLGWVDTFAGLLFPGLISAFGIFLMKQFMESVPSELLDAARIDGMSEWGILFKIAVPLVRPALATLFILSFLGSWNAFIWPLIITQTEANFTIPVGTAFFSSELKDNSGWVMIMTGAAVSVLPLILLFFLFQKQIIRGISLTGLK